MSADDGEGYHGHALASVTYVTQIRLLELRPQDGVLPVGRVIPFSRCGIRWQNDMDDVERAREYRAEAMEARAKACAKTDRDVQRTLLQIATDYESMANDLEALHRSQATLKRLEEH